MQIYQLFKLNQIHHSTVDQPLDQHQVDTLQFLQFLYNIFCLYQHSEYGDCDNNNDFNDDEEEDVNVYDEDTGILIGSFKPEKPTAEEIAKRTENLQI